MNDGAVVHLVILGGITSHDVNLTVRRVDPTLPRTLSGVLVIARDGLFFNPSWVLFLLLPEPVGLFPRDGDVGVVVVVVV